MSYQVLIKQALEALAAKLQGLTVTPPTEADPDPVALLKTVAMAEPVKMDLTRMPAAYILLDKDTIERKTQFLEMHTLSIVVSIIRAIRGTQHSDIELEKGFHDGLEMIGTVYDAITADRTLGVKTGPIEINNVDYGQAPLDVGVIFWGEFFLETTIRYAPGKPAEASLIEEVTTKTTEVTG